MCRVRADFNVLIRVVLAVTAAVGVGYGAAVLPTRFFVLGTAAIASLLLLKDRLYVLCVITVLYFVGPAKLPPLLDVGGLTLRFDDVLLALLIVDSTMRLTRMPLDPTAKWSLLKVTLPVGAFLVYIAMTLFVVASTHPDKLGMALVSFVRLPVTGLYLIVAYTTFSTEGRLRSFVWFLAFLSAVNVLMGAYQFLLSGEIVVVRRASGFLGPNALGIVSGLLVLLAFVQFRRRMFDSRLVPYVFLIFGCAGIFLGKSISSMGATIVVLSLYQLLSMRLDMLSIVRGSMGLGLAASLLIVLFFALRSGDAQALLALQGGSFVHRLLVAQAGLEIFKQNPIWGVGWRMSSQPDVIGATDIGMMLRSQYRGVSEYLFPDVVAVSVHNMYVQFLAELGLVGTILFVGVVLYSGFVVRAIWNGSSHDARLRGYSEYFAFGLMFLLVWWNTNPLYGGQLESFLCFLFLGALAAIANLSQRSRQR